MILNVTFGIVSMEDIGRIDETVLSKLIRVSQLIIEYLLYSQDYYRNQIKLLDTKIAGLNTKVKLL